MLNAHPRIYLAYETSFYLSDAHSTRQSSDVWLRRYFQTLQFAWLRVHPGALMGKVPWPIPRHELHKVFRALMQLLAERHGRVRCGDKTPRHATRLRSIFHDFPDARVVHIVRDPRDTLASLTSMPWGPSSQLAATAYIARQLAAVQPFRERIHEVRLEDLIADPRRELSAILGFVGERWNDAVLDHARYAATSDVPPLPWLAATKKPTSARSLAGRDPRPTASRRLVEKWLAPAMERYGYRPDAETATSLELARTAARDLPHLGGYLWNGLRYLIETRVRRRPPADAQRLLLRLNRRGQLRYPLVAIPDPPRP